LALYQYKLFAMPAKVSIVIVNWKTPELLAKCLRSIEKDAGFSQFEIHVVDNASCDQSLSILAKDFPYVKARANQDNIGFSKACNQVIPETKGESILLLNPDTVIDDNAISKLWQFMESNPQVGAVGPKVLNDDGTLQLACRRSFPTVSAALFRLTYLSIIFPRHKLFSKYNMTYADPSACIEVDALSGACMMVRRQAIDQIGLLDEDIFMFGEDIDWCWRIKEASWQVYYLPQAVVYHTHGAASRLRPVGASIDLHKGMAVFYRKHLAIRYWAPFNALVYAAIWSRAAFFIVIHYLLAKIRKTNQVKSNECRKLHNLGI
jgi:GT2 family glycosyltransferase